MWLGQIDMVWEPDVSHQQMTDDLHKHNKKNPEESKVTPKSSELISKLNIHFMPQKSLPSLIAQGNKGTSALSKFGGLNSQGHVCPIAYHLLYGI